MVCLHLGMRNDVELEMKKELVQSLESLQASALQRGTKQGLKIYEMAILQLEGAKSSVEILEIHARLKEALLGIDTHGSFTPAEYEIVRAILAL